MRNVGTFDWDFGDGFFALTGDSLDTVKHAYDIEGPYSAIVLYTDTQGTCSQFKFFDLLINRVEACISLISDSVGCRPFEVAFKDSSYAANDWLWDVGVGMPIQGDSAFYTFEAPGYHDIQLLAMNDSTGCQDSARIRILVNDLPYPEVEPDTTVCLGDSVMLYASGAERYIWSPAEFFLKDTGTSNTAFPDSSLNFTITGIDTNDCLFAAQSFINVQQIPRLSISSDTSLIIGERIRLEASSDQFVTYQWSPAIQMDCPECPSPEVQPLDSTTYCVIISDENKCFEVEKCVTILIEKKYSLSLPESFSPNGDGVNDRIYVRGWGLKELQEWKIFNRWGELVYESADLEEGWDGTHKGQPQNMDTYAYLVKALSFEDEELILEGFITLIR